MVKGYIKLTLKACGSNATLMQLEYLIKLLNKNMHEILAGKTFPTKVK